MKKINFSPNTKTEAMKIAVEHISDPDGLACDMDMSVEEAKESAEINRVKFLVKKS